MSSYPLALPTFFLPPNPKLLNPLFSFPFVWLWMPQVIWGGKYFASCVLPFPSSSYFPPQPKGAPPIVFSIQTLHGMFLSREFPISIRTCLLISLLATNNLPAIKPTWLSFLSLPFFFLSPPFFIVLSSFIYFGVGFGLFLFFFLLVREVVGREDDPFVLSVFSILTSTLPFSWFRACRCEVDFGSFL